MNNKTKSKPARKPKRVALVSPIKLEIDWASPTIAYSEKKMVQLAAENQKGD